MKYNLIQLCLGIVGIPFIMLAWSYLFGVHKLPFVNTKLCINQIMHHGSVIGVGTYDPVKKIGYSAYHVLKDCTGECLFADDYVSNMQREGNSDVVYFDLKRGSCKTGVAIESTGGVVLATFLSGVVQKIPVELTGTFVYFYPDYGQSGSPVFDKGKIIGVMSRRYASGGVIELIPRVD